MFDESDVLVMVHPLNAFRLQLDEPSRFGLEANALLFKYSQLLMSVLVDLGYIYIYTELPWSAAPPPNLLQGRCPQTPG